MAYQDYKYKMIEGQHCKRCSKCREYKPMTAEYYLKGNDTKYGIESQCRLCKGKPKFLYKTFNEYGHLHCGKCNSYKERGLFHNDINKHNRGNKGSFCKICTNKTNKEFREKIKGDDIERHLKTILTTSKSRSKRDKLKDLEYNLTKDFIHKLLLNQNYKCALSGLEMTSFINSGKSKFNISIDRVDSSLGYTQDNVQLVCSIINLMKGEQENIDFIKICKNVFENYENSQKLQNSQNIL